MKAELRQTAVGPVATLASLAAGPDAPLVHFAHATGMCAALYRPLLDRLAPYVNLIASDARGHGATRLAADPTALTDWNRYVSDLVALFATFPPAPRVILAGHSLGAAVSLAAAVQIGSSATAAVVLVEPAFVPFAVAADYHRLAFPNPMAVQAARRRAVWPSRTAIRAAYRGRGVFARWADADLDTYLSNAVRDRADGQVELACAPAWEAATFAAVTTGFAETLAAWDGGLTLLHATEQSTVMPADAATIAARPATSVRCFAGADHFLPLAEPAAVADAILAFV